MCGRKGQVQVEEMFSRERLTMERRDCMPIREMLKMASDEKILCREERGSENWLKSVFCVDEVGEAKDLATTHEPWLMAGGGRSGRRMADGRSRGNEVIVEGGAGALHGSDTIVLCDGFWSEGLGVVCLIEDVSMLVEACASKTEFSEATDGIDDLVEEAQFQNV